MNEQDILAMEPGRELDELVIDKVMNWKDRMLITSDGKTSVAESSERSFISYVRLFNPSTDITAAWEVVESLRERKLFVEVLAQSDRYYSEIKRHNGDYLKYCCYVIAKTAPEAICKAALIAVVGGDPDD